MIRYIKFKDKKELFSSIVDNIDDEISLDVVFNRLSASENIFSSLTVDDLACLILLTTPQYEFSKIKKKKPKADPINLIQNPLNISSEVFEPQKIVEEKTKLYPKYEAVMDTAWGEVFIKYMDIYPKIFEGNDPFKFISDFIKPHSMNRLEKTCFPIIKWKEIIQVILNFKKDDDFIVLKVIWGFYIGEKQLNSLPIKLIIEHLSQEKELCVYGSDFLIRPETTLYIQVVDHLVFNYTLHTLEPFDDEEIILKFESKYFNEFYRLILLIINKMNAHNSSIDNGNLYYATWAVSDYLKVRDSFSSHFMFNLELYPVSVISNDRSGILDSKTASLLVNGLSKFEIFHGLKGSSICFHRHELDELAGKKILYLKLADIFGVPDSDIFTDWATTDSLALTLTALIEEGLQEFAECLLTMWCFIRIIDAKLPINDNGKLTVSEFHPLLNGKYFSGFISFANNLRERKHPLSLLFSRFISSVNYCTLSSVENLLFTPSLYVDSTYTKEEYELKFKEILSIDIWDQLDSITQNELLASERTFEEMRMASKHKQIPTDRAFFIHIGVLLERELKLNLLPFFDKLLENLDGLEFSKFDQRENKDLSWIRRFLESKKYTLGEMMNLITFREKKKIIAKYFPDLYDLFLASKFNETILSDKNLKTGLINLSSKYRNPAAHDSDTILCLNDAYQLRGLLYGENLLRKLFKCRLNYPMT